MSLWSYALGLPCYDYFQRGVKRSLILLDWVYRT